LFDSTEYFVDFDDIGARILKKRSGMFGWLLGAGICILLALFLFVLRVSGGKVGNDAEVFYLGIALICAVIFMITYKKSFYLVKPGNTNAIEFISNKPSKLEVDAFIENIRTRRNKILDEKYGQVNTMLPYEQNHQNLLWLHNNDVIPKEEFDRRIGELNSKFNYSTDRKIGFNLGEN